MRDKHLWLVESPDDPEPPERPGRALAATLPLHGPILPAIDHHLSRLALRAIHEPEARNTLYAAFRPRLDNWVRRARRSCFRSSADPAIEAEDIEQTAFVVFADLLLAWNGRGSVSSYVLAYFRWRLSDAVRRMSDQRRHIPLDGLSRYIRDGSHEADESIALLEALAADLPARQGEVLLLRIRDGLPWSQIATQVGRDIRTAQRDWNDALRGLRKSLLTADVVTTGSSCLT
jgi:RNA polymerase sigma factor (sigma-70 family)